MEIATIIAGPILSVFFNEILDRLKSTEFQNYFGHGKALAQLDKWENKLNRINAALDDAEEKQMTDRFVEIWLSNLRDLAYDVEDVLDELTTQVQRNESEKKLVIHPNKLHRFLCSICGGMMNPNTVLFNAEMLANIETITSRMDEIVREKDDLRLGRCIIRKDMEDRERPPTTSLVNESKVFGREEDVKSILQLLKAEEIDFENIFVIPIVGMGGIGKTTLAQLVYNDRKFEFDFRAWVSVGEVFDVFRITKTVFLQFGEGNDTDNDLNSLQVKLKQKLRQKKFLIVLDDVWAEDYEQWTLFCSPFESATPKSRIIITTRSTEVALRASNSSAYLLKELPYNECLSIFAQHALGEINFDKHPNLENTGKEIVKRCQGLPLTAKALGGLLRGKANQNAWEKILNNEIWDLPHSNTGILPALRLSYLHLPPHLKRCFTYCAIFPKGYKFNRDELVLLWMAEGFVHEKREMKKKKELGHQYFDDLLSRSFFQQMNDNKSEYIMHDMINDLARFVDRDTCFHLLDKKLENVKSYSKIRHVSFSPHDMNNFEILERLCKMRNLRTLLSMPFNFQYSTGTNYLANKAVQDLVPKLKRLRALSLTHYDQFVVLPSSIGGLRHLKYLNLSYSEIERLPETLGELLNLETLKLRGCYKLIDLPKGFCNLINMQHLDITGTFNLQEMPIQIGALTSLRVLTKFIVGKSNGLRLSELKKFPHLEGHLQITGLQNVVDIEDAESANLKEMSSLCSLKLEWIGGFLNSRDSTVEVQVLKSLRPHQNLSSLSISYFAGTEFPSWIRDPTLSHMTEMELYKCSRITTFPALGRLPSLKMLKMEGLIGMKEVGGEFYEDLSSFSCLETLEIVDMNEWEDWSWPIDLNGDSIGKFSKLRKLLIGSRPKLVGKLPTFLPSLEELSILNCPQLVDGPKILPSLRTLSIRGCQDSVLRNLSDVCSCTTLSIEDMPGLVRFDESHIEHLVALNTLEINGCKELKYLWADGINLNHLTCLKCLKISSCKELVSFVDGNEGFLPGNLENLTIRNCENLKQLSNGLHSKKFLEDLRVDAGYKFVSFPETGLPESLKHIEIYDCPSLESMPLEIIGEENNTMRRFHRQESDDEDNDTIYSIKNIVLRYASLPFTRNIVKRYAPVPSTRDVVKQYDSFALI